MLNRNIQYRRAVRPSFRLAWMLLLLAPALVAAQDSSQRAVSALGRLEPEGGIIRVAAPSTPQAISGSVLAELHVSEGDYVKKGDLLAITDSMQLMQIALHQAENELELSKLASVAEQRPGRRSLCAGERRYTRGRPQGQPAGAQAGFRRGSGTGPG